MIKQNHNLHNEHTQHFLGLAFKDSTHNFKKTFLRKSFRNISLIGSLFHICFLFLFVSIGMYSLALLNIFSVSLWLLTFYTAYKKWFRTTILIMVLEVVGHAFIATILLSTEAGFHYYLWPALGMTMAIPDKRQKAFLVLCAVIVVIFTYLSVSHTEMGYLSNYPLLQPLILTLNIFFSACSFVFTIGYFEINRSKESKKLFEFANIDDFTQTFNRRFIYKFMGQDKITLQKMGISNYVLVLADIDNLRTINAKHGYKTGEQVILSVTNMIKHHIGHADLAARWGGQEFMLVLTNTTSREAINVIESIQFGLFNEEKPSDDMEDITVSFGVAFSDDTSTFFNLIQQADTNVCEAKRQGKNKIITATA